MIDSIGDYRITVHAAFQMERRSIEERVVREIVAAPEQRYVLRHGRDVLQSRIAFGGRMYLVRVLVDVDRKPAEIVTVYRTSNVETYWRTEP